MKQMRDNLAEISRKIEENLGIHFPQQKFQELERGIIQAARENHSDIELFAKKILNWRMTDDEIGSIAKFLTIGETYFFRELNSFNFFEKIILPDILKKKANSNREIRIWSAACSTGEEVYTIAIILKRAIPDIHLWKIKLIATDINRDFLQKAETGIYREWSFRDVGDDIKAEYFEKKDGFYKIKDEFRSMVNFLYLNLTEDKYPSFSGDIHSMDVIFCRNVLIYFSPDKIKYVASRLYETLNDGGYLITGQTELSDIYFKDFNAVSHFNAIVYKKDAYRNIEKNEKIAIVDKKNELKSKKPHPTVKRFKAEDSVQRALKKEKKSLDTKSDEIYNIDNIIAIYKEGKYEEALKSLLDYSRINRNPRVFALIAEIYANHGNFSSAQKYCLDAISMDEFNPQYHYLLGTIYKEEAKYDEAFNALRRAIYLDKDFIMAYYMLGIINLTKGNSQEAKKNFLTALELVARLKSDEIIPYSDGIPAGKMAEMISSIS